MPGEQQVGLAERGLGGFLNGLPFERQAAEEVNAANEEVDKADVHLPHLIETDLGLDHRLLDHEQGHEASVLAGGAGNQGERSYTERAQADTPQPGVRILAVRRAGAEHSRGDFNLMGNVPAGE